MRISTSIALFLAAASGAHAFATGPAAAFVGSSSSSLKMTKMDKGFTADSGLTVEMIPMYIENLNEENFDESLGMLEPLLTNECVGDKCDTFMEDLKAKAASIGKSLPEGYAPSHH